MDPTQTLPGSLRDLWSWLTASTDDTLLFSIVMLAVTTALAILSRTVQGIIGFVGGRRETRRKRLRACVDFYIDCAFRVKDARNLFTTETGKTLKRRIEDSPRTLRFYVASVNDQTVFDNMKKHRHLFRKHEIALIDEYIGYAKLFDMYYRKTESEEFRELSKERKKAVIDQLIAISDHIDRTAMAMSNGIPYFCKLGAYLSDELASHMRSGRQISGGLGPVIASSIGLRRR